MVELYERLQIIPKKGSNIQVTSSCERGVFGVHYITKRQEGRMIKRFARSLTAVGFAATLATAGAPMALADSASTQGPNSGIYVNSSNNTNVRNDNDVSVTNSNHQTASTGDATVSNNTTGGNATSGDATNNNSTWTSVSISNSTPAMGGGVGGSASTEGPNSPIRLNFSSNFRVSNDNDVNVRNYNNQSAYSGDASVRNNTTGGSATSGNATNNNNTSTSVSINNGGNGGQGGGQGGGGQGGQGGGQVMGATFSNLSSNLAGGQGGAQLPNTSGAATALSAWAVVTIATILASGLYWRFAITPKLKTL
jgi:hypothetical protein